VTADERKSSTGGARCATITPPRKADAPRLTEAERKLKMAERSALLMQLAAIEEYLGIARRCKNCGTDL
jgi:hypothetical protein